MKLNKFSQEPVGSNYDRNETFTVNNVPEHFDSITNESLSKIKRNAIEKVEKDTNLKPSALQMALKSIDGQFEKAYNTLEGDYSARKAKLQAAYIQGVSDLRKAFKNFELQVATHNIAFENFSAANEAYNGTPLPDDLKYSKEELDNIRNMIKEL